MRSNSYSWSTSINNSPRCHTPAFSSFHIFEQRFHKLQQRFKSRYAPVSSFVFTHNRSIIKFLFSPPYCLFAAVAWKERIWFLYGIIHSKRCSLSLRYAYKVIFYQNIHSKRKKKIFICWSHLWSEFRYFRLDFDLKIFYVCFVWFSGKLNYAIFSVFAIPAGTSILLLYGKLINFTCKTLIFNR